MKSKASIITLIVISAALGITMWSFSSGMSVYVDVKTARTSKGSVQIRGIILRDEAHPIKSTPEKRTLSFWIEDVNKEKIEVVYYGGKPDAFDSATGTAAHGYVRRDANGREFIAADKLIVQCPSRYDDKTNIYMQKPKEGK